MATVASRKWQICDQTLPLQFHQPAAVYQRPRSPHTRAIGGIFEFTFILPKPANAGNTRSQQRRADEPRRKTKQAPSIASQPPSQRVRASLTRRCGNSSGHAPPKTVNGTRNSASARTAQTRLSKATPVARIASTYTSERARSSASTSHSIRRHDMTTAIEPHPIVPPREFGPPINQQLSTTQGRRPRRHPPRPGNDTRRASRADLRDDRGTCSTPPSPTFP